MVMSDTISERLSVTRERGESRPSTHRAPFTLYSRIQMDASEEVRTVSIPLWYSVLVGTLYSVLRKEYGAVRRIQIHVLRNGNLAGWQLPVPVGVVAHTYSPFSFQSPSFPLSRDAQGAHEMQRQARIRAGLDIAKLTSAGAPIPRPSTHKFHDKWMQPTIFLGVQGIDPKRRC